MKNAIIQSLTDNFEYYAKKTENGEIEEQWTGSYIFENEWQSFRTKKKRTIELTFD